MDWLVKRYTMVKGEVMNTIEKRYTAKEAMQSIVKYLNDGTEQAIQTYTIRSVINSERKLLIRMLGHWLHKNRKRAFLLAETEESVQRLKRHIESRYNGIRIVEIATWEEHGVSNDKLLNRINGAEADCIIASLPYELEERFTEQSRLSLHAKVWMGIGNKREWDSEKNFVEKMKIFLNKLQV